jgi:hypothetical protein
MTRRAVFLIPTVPVSRVLPEESAAPSLIENECVLGGIRVELTLAGDKNTSSAMDGVVSAVSAAFGPSARELDPMESQYIRRDTVTLWRKSESTVRLSPPRKSTDEPDLTLTSYLPGYHYQLVDIENDDLPAEVTFKTRPEIFDLAMRTAAMDDKLSQPMEKLFHASQDVAARTDTSQPPPFSVTSEQLASVLKEWLGGSANLPPQRKAAALLAAQAVLDTCWYPIEFESGADLGHRAAKPLEAIGVTFSFGGPDGTVTDVTWLEDAYKLDPSGPIGDALTYMSLVGWYQLAPIQVEDANGLDSWDNLNTYLIATGTGYLSHPRDPARVAEIEYVIACSYSDRVAIAEGIGDPVEGVPGPPTQSQIDLARGAREEAIRYYRAMLAIDKTSKQSIDGWRSAWKLMAGLPLDSHNAHGDA